MVNPPTGLAPVATQQAQASGSGEGRILSVALDTTSVLASTSLAIGTYVELAAVLAAGATPVGLSVVLIMASFEVIRNGINLLSNVADRTTAEKVHDVTYIVSLPGIVAGTAAAILTRNEESVSGAAKAMTMLFTLGSLEREVEKGVIQVLSHAADVKDFTEWFEKLINIEDKPQQQDDIDVHWNDNAPVLPSGLSDGDGSSPIEVVC